MRRSTNLLYSASLQSYHEHTHTYTRTNTHTLSLSHTHTHTQEAQSDSFVVAGTITVYYAQVFQKFQITCRIENMTVESQHSCLMSCATLPAHVNAAAASPSSHAPLPPHAAASASTQDEDDLDFFSDPEWQNSQIVKPCSVYYTFSWSDAFGCVPSVMTLDTPGCDALLSHQDVGMLSVVVSTLSASMRADDDGSHTPAAKKTLTPPPPPRILEISAEIGSLAFAFAAKSHTKPWMHVKVERVLVEGKRMLDRCFKINGSLGAIEIIDSSVKHTRHPKILTGSEGVDEMVSFEISTYDSASSLFPGYGLAVKLSVTSPKITLLWRFITSLNLYIASFRTPKPRSSASPPPKTFTHTHAHAHAPVPSPSTATRSGGIMGSSTNKMPFDMPSDFSAHDVMATPQKREDTHATKDNTLQAARVRTFCLFVDVDLCCYQMMRVQYFLTVFFFQRACVSLDHVYRSHTSI